ncbi:MAG TPA: hypothetical protein VMX95_08565, partial [Thermodesulfobacteriota bacterium]|nr:hypothetical protein [Thermodesulfobacteriota bacterium]
GNRFLLTIFLLGQPELLQKIKTIKQLEQRIAVKYCLTPFNLQETMKYIFFRQEKAGGSQNLFSRDAIEMVYDHTQGLPRMINHLCDLALLIGSDERRTLINLDIIKDILDDGTIF